MDDTLPDDVEELPDEDGPVLSIGVKAADGKAKGASSLSRRTFFDRVVAGVRGGVAPDLQDFHVRSHGYLVKIHYDNERVHYEVWPDSHRGTIEIGLHFEDGPASTAAFLRFFDERIVELKHQLGVELELERWTVSWGHIYYLIPLVPLDGAKARESAGLLARLIDVLEPLVREAAVSRERVDQPVERRRFERRARS
jgi:hypothetical protein